MCYYVHGYFCVCMLQWASVSAVILPGFPAVLCSYYVFIVYVREWAVVGTLLHYCRAQCDLLLRVIAVWF